jgi:hypothetical protein
MPELPDLSELPDQQLDVDQLRDIPGLATLVAEAEATWRARARTDEPGKPGWRAFEDAFPTFYEFTNRPR